jgi:hypothetical protein
MANAATAGPMPASGQIRTASGLNVILGIWLIIAPFIFAMTAAAFWNDILVGLFVLILASTRVSRPTASTKPASWTNAIVGIWLILAPFVLDYLSIAEIWDDIAVGVLLLILGTWSGSLPRRTPTATTTATDTTATDTTATGAQGRGAQAPGAQAADDRPDGQEPPRD